MSFTRRVTFTSPHGSDPYTQTDEPEAPVVEQLAVMVFAAEAAFDIDAAPIVRPVAAKSTPKLWPIILMWFTPSPFFGSLSLID